MEKFFPFVQEQNIIHQSMHILKDMGAKKDRLARLFQLADEIDNFFCGPWDQDRSLVHPESAVPDH